MIDERFSAAAFDAKGLNTKQSLRLAKDLASEIQAELHTVILNHTLKIIERLNAMGHNLKLSEPETPGDISYYDGTEDKNDHHVKLRVGIDTIISTGYAHFVTNQDSNDPSKDWLDPNSWPDNECA